MKIIAATKYEFIVQMTPEELRMLSAVNNTPDSRDGTLSHHMGRQFTLNSAYARLGALERNRKDLDRIVGQFKAMGELLEPVIMEIERATSGESEGL